MLTLGIYFSNVAALEKQFMANKDNISSYELNLLISNLPPIEGIIPYAKQWLRVNVGDIEVYVGDQLFIVALITTEAKTKDELQEKGLATEKTILNYLRSEGFIDKNYAYIGLQRFDGNEGIPETK